MHKTGVFTLSILSLPGLTNCKMANTIHENNARPPGIIIFLSDDQGYGDFRITGNTQLETPNIDQMAEDGAFFTRFYVSPVCSPTRSEMLTGRYHPRSGVTDTSRGGERLCLEETTIAEIFHQAGYATALFGKWHNGMQHPYHPNSRGFDEFYGFCSGHWGNYFSPPMDHNGNMITGNGYMTDDLIDRAIQFINLHSENPFFIVLSLNTPHSPMQVPDEWWERFSNKNLHLRGTIPHNEDIQHTRAALAMVENIDWNVGRIMQTLRDLKIEDHTIVMFFNDNGPNGHRWNAGLKGIKGSVDEGGVRSPLFIQWKEKITGNTQIEFIAAAIDLFPTLIDMAGINPGVDLAFDGISLAPHLFNDQQMTEWPDRVIFSHWFNRISARNQQYFYSMTGELFDLLCDPGQTTDISEKKQDVAHWFADQLSQWKQEVFSGINTIDLPFTVGHPQAVKTQLPARDASSSGDIKRSSRHPNDSFFTNWTNSNDTIFWNVDILQPGHYRADLYYACHQDNIGCVIELSGASSSITTTILKSHYPPLKGMEHDRVPREESYVKHFKQHAAGVIYLNKSTNQLVLKALKIPGTQAIDLKYLVLTKVEL